MGSPPQWYSIIKAARYLEVAPWDLIDQPISWYHMALEAEAAELHAQNEHQKRAAKKR